MWTHTPSFVPNRIVVFGTGGTGSRLVPLLSQFIKTCNWVLDPQITIIDFDVVEEKNLARQNFILTDVGKNKAQVLANRYSKAYGVPITPITCKLEETVIFSSKGGNSYRDKEGDDPQKILNETAANNLFSTYFQNTIVVMCVDSPEARRAILESVLTCAACRSGGGSSTLIFDTGNENDFGQVTWSHAMLGYHGLNEPQLSKSVAEIPKLTPIDVKIGVVPLDYEYYQNMKAADNLSCADLDQTMAINSQVANITFGLIQSYYYAKPIQANRFNINLVHGVTPQYMSASSILSITKPSYHEWTNKNRAFGSLLVDTGPNLSTAVKQGRNFAQMMAKM